MIVIRKINFIRISNWTIVTIKYLIIVTLNDFLKKITKSYLSILFSVLSYEYFFGEKK